MTCRLRIRKPALHNKSCGVDPCQSTEGGRIPGSRPPREEACCFNETRVFMATKDQVDG